ncbi:MAG: protein kinase [Labilithrix sp.]|nr:protein kinase [Labilithrix sp.]
MTQRDAPPLPPGLEDEEEERTTVGTAPEPIAPSKLAPPRVHFGKNNTPTAFTPQAQQAPQPAQTPVAPHAQQAHAQQVHAQQAHAQQAHAQGPPSSSPDRASGHHPSSDPNPPKSQSMPRPPTLGLGTPIPPVAERGSSGPQPLTHKPSMGPGPAAPPVPPHAMGGPPAPNPNSMMFGPPPAPQPQRDMSFAGPPPSPNGPNMQQPPTMGGGSMTSGQSLGFRADAAPREGRSAPFAVVRSRAYSFVLDARGQPIELGSGRFAKVFLGEERWLESKTDFRRPIVIKILQKGVNDEDHMRFQMEMELLERVQGHPSIVELYASGEGEDPSFLPPIIRDKCEPEFMILEKLDMSLEERLKGSRNRGAKEDLLASDMRERLFRVLDYMIPIASAIEYAHLVRNICHRDIKPANVLVGLPDPNLRGSTLQVRLADFNVAKLSDEEVSFGMTQMKAAVPGTLFFQSPEQETNILELLVNVQQGLPEVEYFEDFYIQIAKNDSFSLFNRSEQYPILYADRARKRLVLARPFRETSETNVRARIQKSVGRPADIYSLGATFYYLISGAYANPKTLYDAFHKFIEYERADENNTIEAYLRHEYSVINSLRAPKTQDGQPEVAPADRFFSYKHYLDGNGELIDPNVMLIIGKCMIRNKPDSYCQAHDLDTRGVSELVTDLINLYSLYGFSPGARPTHLVHRTTAKKGNLKMGGLKRMWQAFVRIFTGKKGP